MKSKQSALSNFYTGFIVENQGITLFPADGAPQHSVDVLDQMLDLVHQDNLSDTDKALLKTAHHAQQNPGSLCGFQVGRAVKTPELKLFLSGGEEEILNAEEIMDILENLHDSETNLNAADIEILHVAKNILDSELSRQPHSVPDAPACAM